MIRILVVDDEDSVRQMLSRVLESAGYEVEAASNGLEAVEHYNRKPADLVIMDIIMPEKEGIETIIELRRDHPEVKILAISGTGENSPYLLMAKHLGADSILDKPFSPDQLIEKIEMILNS